MSRSKNNCNNLCGIENISIAMNKVCHRTLILNKKIEELDAIAIKPDNLCESLGADDISINCINDVNINNPNENEYLCFDDDSQQWVNKCVTMIKDSDKDTFLTTEGSDTDILRGNADNGFYLTGDSSGNIPIEGAGTRMMFYPGKAGSFRSGRVTGTQWDDVNQGSSSFGVGNNNIASGMNSMSTGNGNTASGMNSVSTGNSNIASGEQSTTFGLNTMASAENTLAGGLASFASATGAFAYGNEAMATGSYSHAIGNSTMAVGFVSHSEGIGSLAGGTGAHAEGNMTRAIEEHSHAEGNLSNALGRYCHVEGDGCTGIGLACHAEGNETRAEGDNSHAEGSGTIASGSNSHAEGALTLASSSQSHAEGGVTTASGENSHSEGVLTTASGDGSHAEGRSTSASGAYSHAEGDGTIASGINSHAEGQLTVASGDGSHAEGDRTTASGTNSHAEGGLGGTMASGNRSHAEGARTTASGTNSHAEGNATEASGNDSHAEGSVTIASGENSHSEGVLTTASGDESHAEGRSTTASGDHSHAEGNATTASGVSSHAEGLLSFASGAQSFAGGDNSFSIQDTSFTHGVGLQTLAVAGDPGLRGRAAFGVYNEDGLVFTPPQTRMFMIGVGTGLGISRLNGFSVTIASAGTTSCNCNTTGAFFSGGGADFAECFESYDGQPIALGTTVVLHQNSRFVKASALKQTGDSQVIGVISKISTIIGNTGVEAWLKRNQKNIFGEEIYDDISVEVEEPVLEIIEKTVYISQTIFDETKQKWVKKLVPKTMTNEIPKMQTVTVYDEDDNIIGEEEVPVTNKKTIIKKVPRLNPDFDPNLEYKSRLDRPEWQIVGLLGQVIIMNDQEKSSNWIKMEDIDPTCARWFIR